MLEKIFFYPELCPKILLYYFFECKWTLFGNNKLLCEKDSYLKYFCKVWNVKNKRIQSYESLKMYWFSKEFIIERSLIKV